MPLTLLIGGVRSGKSRVAEEMARRAGRPAVYVATGRGDDPEMAERITAHHGRRPPGWATVESDDPASVSVRAPGDTVLVDDLGGWVAAEMTREGLWPTEPRTPATPLGPAGSAARERILSRVRRFAQAAAARPGLTVVVASEAGMSLVPASPGARRYLDLVGEATQVLTEAAERVELVVAGCRIPLKGGREASAVPAELRLHGDRMVPHGHLDFATNVLPGGPPSWLLARLREALAEIDRYPDEGRAVAAIAERHGRHPDEVLPVNGSAEAFWLLAAALRPRSAAVVHPSFTEPEAALRAHGGAVERVFRRERDFSFDSDRVPTDADLVVLGNPNNPTGNLDPADSIVRVLRPGRVAVIDEAFMEFSPGEPESLAGRGDLPGLVVVRSLTKLWSLPGIRAGYLLGPLDLVARLRETRQPWGVNTLALRALEACAGDPVRARERAEEVAARREELAVSLAALPGVRVWPSAANFLLLEVENARCVRQALRDRGIAVRPADTFPGLGPNHLRVAVRSAEDNRVLVGALREVLAR